MNKALAEEIIQAIRRATWNVEAVMVLPATMVELLGRGPYPGESPAIVGLPLIEVKPTRDTVLTRGWALQSKAAKAWTKFLDDDAPAWPPTLRPHDMTLCPQCDRLVQTELYAHHFHDHAVLKEKTK